MANKMEIQVQIDETGAIRGYSVIEARGKACADSVAKSFEGAGAGFDKFAESVKRGIEDPLGAAGDAAKGFLGALGPMGAGMAAGVAVFGAFATAGFEAAKALGEYGDQLEDTATRMGLSVKEVSQFTFAMKYAGAEGIEPLEGSMRMLSQALSEGTDDGKKAKRGLAELGIEARDTSGHLRPMSQIFIELSDKLAGIEDVAKRNTIAIQVLGRAGLQVLPDLLELSEGVRRANEIGIKGPSEAELAKWKEYHHTVTEFERTWAQLKRATMQPLAATVVATWKWLQSGQDTFTFGRDDKGNLLRNPNTGMAVNRNPNAGLAYGRQGFYEYDINGSLSAMQGNLFPGGADAALASGVSARDAGRAANKKAIDAVLNRWGMSKQGLDAALAEAKKNESEALAKLQAGDASAIGAFQEAQGRVSSIEAKIKGLADAQKASERIGELIQKYSETAQSAVTKLTLQLDADLKRVNPADRAKLETAAYGAIIRTMEKEYAKSADEAAKAAVEMATALEKADAGIRESIGKSFGFATGDVDNVATLRRVLDAGTPKAAGNIAGPSYDQRSQSLQASEAAQERIVQLLAGPGGEVAAIGQIAAMRASLAAQERTIAEERANSLTDELERSRGLYDAKYGYEEKLLQIQRDNAIQLLELRKKNEDEYVNAVKGGFRALVSGGRSGLGSFVGSQLMGFGETALGNVTRMGYEKVQGSIPGFSPDSMFGKLFAGTPLVKAGDIQLTAAQMQYKAATVFAGAVGMGGPGGVVSGVPFGGVIGGLPSLFSGASRTNPFIFSATQGTRDIVGDNGLAIPGTGSSPANNGTFNASGVYGGGLSRGARGIGIAGAVAGGAIGAYEGIQQGGAKGALTASGSLAGAAGTIMMLAGMTGPAAPIVAGIGLALSLAPMLFGDPKKKYAANEERMLDRAKYTAPDSSTYTFDKSGKAFDYDDRGNMRTYQTVNINVSSWDSEDVGRFVDKNSDHFAETIRKAIPNHGGLRLGIQSAVNP